MTADPSGFTPAELRNLRSLKNPYGIQKFLDDMPYHLKTRVVSAESAGGADVPLPGGRDFRRRRAAGERISSAAIGFRGRAGHRSRDRDLPGRRLWVQSRIKLHRMPVAGVPSIERFVNSR